MSALAHAIPAQRPVREKPVRHIEVVPSRSQRNARPRLVYAIVTVGGLFAILIAQLLLSIVVSNGAYQITALQSQQKELTRDQQMLTEQLQVLESPQHLAANAEALGMVGNSSTAYLRLADGAVLGAPVAAKATDGIRLGKDGQTLIPNTLLTGVSLAVGQGVEDGAPVGDAKAESVASSSGIPSPITR